jgi:hypothetical protein
MDLLPLPEMAPAIGRAYRMSRRSGSGSPIKDMRNTMNLRRVLHPTDHKVTHYEWDAL